ncbi:RNA polymerase sigma factor RpoH [Candidatus Profftella armatura (Diaphorina cf. continua)]|uniref:RNA polymerase sigma factor n=1 Tax=Candidatus Profftella armatura (Diaphorina cf. continua) TaxID=2661583 RepID=A0A7R6VZ08_9PROT|nr:RNA polymerase sigma factor RpoH [Candidatus Profftella armatura (Diaphorina cf. continua)]BCG49763.1 RNA polymerase sigma factor RpoH [Candidatus Profftella armatura (Diaphorina cf. continua)]
MKYTTNNSLIINNSYLACKFFGTLGNIDKYIKTVNNLPILSYDEEISLAYDLQKKNNLNAAQKIILSHLRLVVSISKKYLGYSFLHSDLIQEGNIGLMKAVKRFNPDQGVRLASYAIHWIRAEIHEYILKNCRLVKIATTKSQRKLFFNLRNHKENLNSMTSKQIDLLAETLDVKRKDVIEMETRLSGKDITMDYLSNNNDKLSLIFYLSLETTEPIKIIESLQYNKKLKSALNKLDIRSRRIVKARWLVNENNSTLHELAKEFSVSAERIRQIETVAFKKMKNLLKNSIL